MLQNGGNTKLTQYSVLPYVQVHDGVTKENTAKQIMFV